MEADAREELRALRARAYGPGADIHEDPVARERLRELEALVQEQARDRADAASPPAAASAEPSEPEGEPDAGREPTSEEPAPEPRSPRRISAGWWAASVVAALAVGAGGAVAVTAVSQGAGGAQVIASLPPEPEVPWPRFLGAETGDSTSFREFYGLADMVGSGSGYQWACGTRSFPPSVQFEVGSSNSLPDELRARFPAGTELQFTYVPSPRDDVDAPRIEITEIPPAEDVDAQD
ncbi:hypothetical protein [Microbacterium aurantiacum]|uniref:Uncharacterized protein n=1 Tax=Microbacterium aurantiacum TaxID=162393 RepID=A0A0M9VMF6_9MICO|nr:hypothetical protein [Microbacterium chocolatum]ANG84668.1 hypothetical protein A8L33_04045 [Microbacterium chocolatum]KOS12219.1 hypothetical protein XI38_02240 [Microbacterium chocolatum]